MTCARTRCSILVWSLMLIMFVGSRWPALVGNWIALNLIGKGGCPTQRCACLQRIAPMDKMTDTASKLGLRSPANGATAGLLARLYLQAGAVRQAVGSFEAFRDTNPDRVETMSQYDHTLLQAILLAQEGDWERALSVSKLALTLLGYQASSDLYPSAYDAMASLYDVRLSDPTLSRSQRADALYHLAYYRWLAGDCDDAHDDLESLRQAGLLSKLVATDQAQALALLGRAAEARGDWQQARSFYVDAIEVDERFIPAYGRLDALCGDQPGLAATCRSPLEAADLAPKIVPSLSPSVTVSTTVWSLVGLDFDPTSAESGPMMPVTLYWQPIESHPSWISPENWLCLGSHCIQRLELVNRMPNATFEHDRWLGEGMPSGYQEDVYHNYHGGSDRIECMSLARVERLGEDTTVGRLSVGPTCERVGFASGPLGVTPGAVYLVAGQARAFGNRANLMYQWYGQGLGALPLQSRPFETVKSPEWVNLVGLMRAPHSADTVKVWLIAGEPEVASGMVEWDNIVLAELPLPLSSSSAISRPKE